MNDDFVWKLVDEKKEEKKICKFGKQMERVKCKLVVCLDFFAGSPCISLTNDLND